MEPMCCVIKGGPFSIEVPLPQDTGESEKGGRMGARDWNGFAQAVIAILQALAQILGPIIGQEGMKAEQQPKEGNTPAKQPTGSGGPGKLVHA